MLGQEGASSQEFQLCSHMDGRNLNAWTISCCMPGHMSGNLDGRHGAAETWTRHSSWGVDIPSGSLSCDATIPCDSFFDVRSYTVFLDMTLEGGLTERAQAGGHKISHHLLTNLVISWFKFFF